MRYYLLSVYSVPAAMQDSGNTKEEYNTDLPPVGSPNLMGGGNQINKE